VSRSLRFAFVLALVALGTVVAAVGGWRYARASAPVPGPVILISIDTLRADHLPAYGYRSGRTPAIDLLAKDGVVFERAYAHAVQTLPAHAAMLSGRLPFETGVRDDLDATIRPDVRMLAQMLSDRGYGTGGIVSSGALGRQTGFSRGFDFFDDATPPSGVAIDIAGTDLDEIERDGAESEAAAERWLDEAGSRRLFLFLHLNEPHAPYAPPAPLEGLAPYDGEIAYADGIVGRLVQYLKSHQLYDRSTIILSSDHGEGLGDHGEQEHGLFVYREAVHVPLIIKQAGGAGAGRRVKDLVQHADIVPTILDLARAPGAGDLAGRSLKRLLDGDGKLPARMAYAEAPYGHRRFGWSAVTSLTDGTFQYVKAAREELYDLEPDPDERRNLAEAADRETGTNRRGAPDFWRTALDNVTGNQPVTVAVDPGDRVRVAETYRTALNLRRQGRWTQALSLLQRVLREEPEAVVVWKQMGGLALRAERYELAAAAYQRVVELEPSDVDAYFDAATALMKARRLTDARVQIERSLVGREADAALASRARAALSFVDARLLIERGTYADALPVLERAAAESREAAALPDLYFAIADTLMRLDRQQEAEAHFLEELRRFPHNMRARAALGGLYRMLGRGDDAGRVASELVRWTPTPEAYALASRLWAQLGDRAQAEAVRAEARRLFPRSPRAAH
jgi:arylsulfatase A-like enzyme/Tfp pilus assembly protein PilF